MILVLLSGAHTIGYLHLNNTDLGHLLPTPYPNVVDGAWDDTPHVFDNNYFNFLLNSVSHE
jgi:hypothetical protein